MRDQSFVVLRPADGVPVPKREPKLQAPPSRNGGRALRAPTWLSLIGSSHREPRTTMIAYVLARSRRVTRLVRANRTTVHSVHHQDVGAGAMRRPGGSSPRPARAARTSVHSERRPKRVRTIALLHPPAMPKRRLRPPEGPRANALYVHGSTRTVDSPDVKNVVADIGSLCVPRTRRQLCS